MWTCGSKVLKWAISGIRCLWVQNEWDFGNFNIHLNLLCSPVCAGKPRIRSSNYILLGIPIIWNDFLLPFHLPRSTSVAQGHTSFLQLAGYIPVPRLQLVLMRNDVQAYGSKDIRCTAISSDKKWHRWDWDDFSRQTDHSIMTNRKVKPLGPYFIFPLKVSQWTKDSPGTHCQCTFLKQLLFACPLSGRSLVLNRRGVNGGCVHCSADSVLEM